MTPSEQAAFARRALPLLLLARAEVEAQRLSLLLHVLLLGLRRPPPRARRMQRALRLRGGTQRWRRVSRVVSFM